MELSNLVQNRDIVGVIGSYKPNFSGIYVQDLNIKKLEQAFLMVGLDISAKDKKVQDLNDAEKLKLDLAKQLYNDIIIVGELSSSLNKKDLDYIKKLLLKLQEKEHKKIIIIDNKVDTFFFLTKDIVVFKNNEIVYETSNYFNLELYNYTRMPKIVEFINYVNKDKKILNENIDILELIKDIYRSV